jgi:hypothetical protein
MDASLHASGGKSSVQHLAASPERPFWIRIAIHRHFDRNELILFRDSNRFFA